MKEFISFITLCVYILGVVGGFGYLMMTKEYPIAFAVVVLGVMAFPTARNCWNILTK